MNLKLIYDGEDLSLAQKLDEVTLLIIAYSNRLELSIPEGSDQHKESLKMY